MVEVEDSVIYRYGTALLLFLFILTISGLCMGFWYLQAYHRETHEKIDDLKSDLGKKIEDVGKKVEKLGKEIKTDLKLQREAMDLVVPELVSLRQKCRNKLKPKLP